MSKTILEQLKESKNPFIQSSMKDIDMWKKLPHNKEGLESILRFNICQITYRKTDEKKKTSELITFIATSDTPLIKMFSLQKGSNEKKQLDKLSKMKSDGIHIKEPFYAMTWDLEKNDYHKFPLKDWSIALYPRFTIDEENRGIIFTELKTILEHSK